MSIRNQVMGAAGAASGPPVYIEDVFSTDLYTGASSGPAGPAPANTIDPYSQSYGWFTRTGGVDSTASGDERQTVVRVNGVTAYDGAAITTLSYSGKTYTPGAYVGSNYGFGGDYCNSFAVNASGLTITNGIDLAGKGGLVWLKKRNAATDHMLFDTARGASIALNSNATYSNDGPYAGYGVTAFNATGYSLGNAYASATNDVGFNYVSWTFRQQDKFHKIVKHTITAGTNTIAHTLGSVPGCWLIKAMTSDANGSNSWWVHHRSIPTGLLRLEGTSASESSFSTATATNITIANGVFATGTQIVIYLFAHNAGGFGLTGTDNVISCGVTDSSAEVNLGWEPQWLLYKNVTNGYWYIIDNMRGWNSGSTAARFHPNTNNSEADDTQPSITATGFKNASGRTSAGSIYIAIRRPMKVPTDATKVFAPVLTTGGNAKYTTGFPVDISFAAKRDGGPYNTLVHTRLIGNKAWNVTSSSASETVPGFQTALFDSNTECYVGAYGTANPFVTWNFKRAPGFCDEVQFKGTGSATTVAHGLGVVPELMIIKARDFSGGRPWPVYHSGMGNTKFLYLNTTDAAATNPWWNDTTPTASVFTVGSNSVVNYSGTNYVALLFASCPGVSKVGSYTGTGATLQINCGFAGGARFVLVRRTDANGNWFIWDTARGVISAADPTLALNSDAAEFSVDWIDPYSAGFELSSTFGNDANVSGATYIFLAIA